MKKLIFNVLIFFISSVILYLLVFIYFFFTFEKDFKYNFQSLENLNFYKEYSKKVHHLRPEHLLRQFSDTNLLDKKKGLLFNKLNNSTSDKIILFQGDSWFEQINGFQKVKDYLANTQKNIKIINAGISSYSPSLMNVQFNILENDFDIKPDVIVVYVDQTDIGDEFCRYRNLRVLDETGNLIKVPYEDFPIHKDPFNLHEILIFSEIELKNNSKIIKTQKYLNYKVIKSLNRIKKQYQKKIKKNYPFEKCGWRKMVNYLKSPNQAAINHFEYVLKEYFKKLNRKKYLKKIFVVTHPHKLHLTTPPEYKVDVSYIVERVLLDFSKINHINFSEIISKNPNFYKDEEGWMWDKSHLKETNYFIFIKKILKIVNS
jgi:hypothetical protein